MPIVRDAVVTLAYKSRIVSYWGSFTASGLDKKSPQPTWNRDEDQVFQSLVTA